MVDDGYFYDQGEAGETPAITIVECSWGGIKF